MGGGGGGGGGGGAGNKLTINKCVINTLLPVTILAEEGEAPGAPSLGYVSFGYIYLCKWPIRI